MSSLWAETAATLLERTASADPTPGGGSTAAVSGALGLGLVIMALEVSVRRKDPHPDVATVLADARALLPLIMQSADEDVQAFDAYMRTLALPKGTEDEKRERREALQRAAFDASRSPLGAAQRLVTALQLAQAGAPIVTPAVVSDVGAGAALLGGALRAMLFTVDINLPHVAPDFRADLTRERDEVRTHGETLERDVEERVAQRLKR